MRVSSTAILYILLFLQGLNAQQKTNIYNVIYKGDNVGNVQLIQSIHGDSIHYKMTSDIRTKFLFTIRVKSFEESAFKNGRLLYSAVNRTVNGDEKVKKQTRAGNRIYTLSGDGREAVLHNDGITYNLMRMYCLEPVNMNQVYSDNYQRFLKITKIKAHTYKVDLPDGNYNYYTYANGVCSKVEVFSSLYNMELVLRQDAGMK